MLNFKELSTDGTSFELLLREFLFSKGYDVHWSGIGPDAGKDLICIEKISSELGPSTRRWLVQCKHFAHAGRSVGIADLGSIIESCRQHRADGYLLACSTYASAGVVERLRAISDDPSNHLLTAIVDSSLIERQLMAPSYFHIVQRFFPQTAKAIPWQVNFTTSPNHFVACYKGYIFHIMNRIGSKFEHHFHTIENRIADMEKIPFVEGEFLRPRFFRYDDKNGGYVVALDHMVPHGSTPSYNLNSLKLALGDGDVLEDGQHYSFDIIVRRYLPMSDHYDPDHYSFYSPYIGSYLIGEGKQRRTIPSEEWTFSYDDPSPIVHEGEVIDAGAERPFRVMVDALRSRFGKKFIGARNAYPEALFFVKDGSLRHLAIHEGIFASEIATATLRFWASAKEDVYNLIESISFSFECIVSCDERIVFAPDDKGKYRRDIEADEERVVVVSLTAPFSDDALAMRNSFSSLFLEIADKLLEN